MTHDRPLAEPGSAPAATLLRLLQDLLRPAAPGEAEPLAAGALAARRGQLVVFALAAFALHGFVGGLFQGGEQLLWAALKAPLVVLFAVALCAPSFVVLTAMSGTRIVAGRLADGAAAFLAALALVLLGLLPVVWLFSVTSRYLAAVVLFQLLAWLAAIGLARRALVRAVGARAAGAYRGWALLLLVVSLQAATYLQPILWRAPGERLFPRPRQLFFEHFERTFGVRLPESRQAPAGRAAGASVTPPADER